MFNDPARHYKDMNFDDCIEWSKSFYILTPIVDVIYLENLHRRLVNSISDKAMPSVQFIMAIGDLKSLGNKGLMSCSCGTFLHRAWCMHSCADAKKKEIIMRYPSNMGPTNVEYVGRGRPRTGHGKRALVFSSE